MSAQRRTPPPIKRHAIPMTGSETRPAQPTTRWIKWFVTPDGRVGARPGPPDSLMRVRPLAGFVPVGTPDEARQRAEAEAEAARRTAA